MMMHLVGGRLANHTNVIIAEQDRIADSSPLVTIEVLAVRVATQRQQNIPEASFHIVQIPSFQAVSLFVFHVRRSVLVNHTFCI